jgi:hypothetical protein
MKDPKVTLQKRKRFVIELECNKFEENFEENLKYVNKWQIKLDQLLKQDNLNRFLKHSPNNDSVIGDLKKKNKNLEIIYLMLFF